MTSEKILAVLGSRIALTEACADRATDKGNTKDAIALRDVHAVMKGVLERREFSKLPEIMLKAGILNGKYTTSEEQAELRSELNDMLQGPRKP